MPHRGRPPPNYDDPPAAYPPTPRKRKKGKNKAVDPKFKHLPLSQIRAYRLPPVSELSKSISVPLHTISWSLQDTPCAHATCAQFGSLTTTTAQGVSCKLDAMVLERTPLLPGCSESSTFTIDRTGLLTSATTKRSKLLSKCFFEKTLSPRCADAVCKLQHSTVTSAPNVTLTRGAYADRQCMCDAIVTKTLLLDTASGVAPCAPYVEIVEGDWIRTPVVWEKHGWTALQVGIVVFMLAMVWRLRKRRQLRC